MKKYKKKFQLKNAKRNKLISLSLVLPVLSTISNYEQLRGVKCQAKSRAQLFYKFFSTIFITNLAVLFFQLNLTMSKSHKLLGNTLCISLSWNSCSVFWNIQMITVLTSFLTVPFIEYFLSCNKTAILLQNRFH